MDDESADTCVKDHLSVVPDVCVIPDRDFRIDLFRGLSLWLIFLDHIPESYLNNLTPRNFGFSDAAEILVFLSGLACGMVYGQDVRERGAWFGVLRVLRRSFQIYFAQIVTVALLLGEAWLFAIRRPELLDHANVTVFFADPLRATLQIFAMRYSPVNLDPLLLMTILHFGLVVALPAIVRFPTPALLFSAALYTAAHLMDWSIPAYPRGVIYFNPLNWQLLFVIGVWWGLNRDERVTALLRSNVLASAAAIYVLFALSITLGWQIHSLESYVPEWLSRLIYPIDKSNLDPLRLVHFFSVALLCWRVLPSNFSVLAARILRPLIQSGEYSLEIYCASVLLSFAAHAVLGMGWNNLVMQTLVSVAGIFAMAKIAALLARNERTGTCHPRTI